MRTRSLLASALFASSTSVSLACSCFGPQTFCETLDPPFPNPEWWIPDVVVLGVKLSDYQHGMDVKIVQSFSGTLQPDDTIRVWGDCGLLCRHYPGTWAVGDTVIWGFKITDLAGNSLCGTSFEQPTDYMISICGVYYLDYANGVVTGPITTTVIENMPISQFEQLVGDCLSTNVGEPLPQEGLLVWYDGDVPVIDIPAIITSGELRVIDIQGRSVLSLPVDGGPERIEGLRTGTYLVMVEGASTRALMKVIVQ